MKNSTQKLNKASRLALIASLCAGGMSASLMPSKKDISEETALVTRGQDTGELVNDDLPVLGSILQFDSVKAESEDYMLTAKEKRQLQHELAEYKRLQRKKYQIVIAGFWG